MNLQEYQDFALSTAIYPNKGENLIYPVLGLCGEAGEVAEKLKKIIRDKEGVVSASDIDEIEKELGDVMWYIAAICHELDITMNGVIDANVSKLKSRQERNQIHGSGDNR
jgi:NTP pyrophosphatase (non-canonical NTP hydrolase)